jgi:hypothetical protein
MRHEFHEFAPIKFQGCAGPAEILPELRENSCNLCLAFHTRVIRVYDAGAVGED